jgi:hypothetical protein
MVNKTTHGKLKFTTKEIIAIFPLPPFHLNVAQHSGSIDKYLYLSKKSFKSPPP